MKNPFKDYFYYRKSDPGLLWHWGALLCLLSVC